MAVNKQIQSQIRTPDKAPHPYILRSTLSSSMANSSQLSEQYVQDSFHSYLRSSLTQAKAERLLDAELLSSAESDLMITGVSNFNDRTIRSLDQLSGSRSCSLSIFRCSEIDNQPAIGPVTPL
jgi:hypothetical protein